VEAEGDRRLRPQAADQAPDKEPVHGKRLASARLEHGKPSPVLLDPFDIPFAGSQRAGVVAEFIAEARAIADIRVCVLVDIGETGSVAGRLDVGVAGVVARDEFKHQTGKETTVKVADVQFEPRVAVRDCILGTGNGGIPWH